jgi:hypothetical protein
MALSLQPFDLTIFMFMQVNSNYKCHELALELSNSVMEALTPYYAEQVGSALKHTLAYSGLMGYFCSLIYSKFPRCVANTRLIVAYAG